MIATLRRLFRRERSDATNAAIAMTPGELALALHAVENRGRMARYGTTVCRHDDKAQRVMAWLRDHETLRLDKEHP